MTTQQPISPADRLAAWLRLWPSHTALAAAMGVPPQTARYWIVRGRIPPRYWPQFTDVMRDQHQITVTTDHLAAVYQDTPREVA